MPHFVYIVECCDTTLYTGIALDVKKRLHAHNHLTSGAKYTKTRRPVKLMYKEKYKTLREAMQREYAIKQFSRKKKLLLI